jgi:predicted ATPase with chaperone activity
VIATVKSCTLVGIDAELVDVECTIGAMARSSRSAEMPSAVMRATCKLGGLGERTLADLVAKRRSFTARRIDRLIKVARTIADLLGQDDLDAGCLLEAAACRDADPTADLVFHVA